MPLKEERGLPMYFKKRKKQGGKINIERQGILGAL
jgi:hypothetical protein